MQDLMIDIETLSTKKDAVILSVGAVTFDRWTPETYEAILDRAVWWPVDYKPLEVWGGQGSFSVDYDTKHWWEQQSSEAQHLAFSYDIKRWSIQYVLDELSDLSKESHTIWANSPTFDLDILRHAYNVTKRSVPWKFYHEMDYRTLVNLGLPDLKGCSRKVPQKFIAHHPKHDAAKQAWIVHDIFERLMKI